MKERMKAKREKSFSAAIPTQLTIRLSSTDTKNENIFLNALCIYLFFNVLRRKTGFVEVQLLVMRFY